MATSTENKKPGLWNRRIPRPVAALVILIFIIAVLAIAYSFLRPYWGRVFMDPGYTLPVTFLDVVHAQSATTDIAGLEAIEPDKVRAYNAINLQEAWNEMRGETLQAVNLGVVDTGIDATHPEFNGVNITSAEPRESLVDQAYNVIDFDCVKFVPAGHGTAVSGIIGANNVSDDTGYTFPQMNGVLSGTLVEEAYTLDLRHSFKKGNIFPLTDFDVQSSIEDSVKAGSSVINMSFGGTSRAFAPFDSCALNASDFEDESANWQQFFERMLETFPDRLFIVAAGNNDISSAGHTPSNVVLRNFDLLNNVLVVGATDLSDNRASFSNFGPGVHLAAPGEDVYAPTDGGGYDNNFNGTSASAPFVTGVAGLLRAINPNLTPIQIRDILISTGDAITTDEFIGPRLNAHAAVCHEDVLDCDTGPPPAPQRFLIKAGLSSGAPPGEEPPRILIADSTDRLWTVYTDEDTSFNRQVFTSFSDDLGRTWTEEQVTTTTRTPTTNVSLAVDSTDTVHVMWAERISASTRGLFHASRTSSAADWASTKETVFSKNKVINLGGLTVDHDDVLHAVWSVQQSAFTSNLFYSKRISATSDWTDNLELVDAKPGISFATAANSIVSDGNSGIHVAYNAQGFTADPTKTHVLYTKRVGSSSDWADNREQITGLNAASGLNFDQFFRALLVMDDETPHLIFDSFGFGDFPNRPQAVVARRTLGTWTLTPLTNNFNGGSAPTITRSSDGTFRAFFMSAGTETHTTISQLFISEGDGVTWSTPTQLTDEPLNQTRPNALITPVPASGYGLVFSESVVGGIDLFFLDGGLSL